MVVNSIEGKRGVDFADASQYFIKSSIVVTSSDGGRFTETSLSLSCSCCLFFIKSSHSILFSHLSSARRLSSTIFRLSSHDKLGNHCIFLTLNLTRGWWISFTISTFLVDKVGTWSLGETRWWVAPFQLATKLYSLHVERRKHQLELREENIHVSCHIQILTTFTSPMDVVHIIKDTCTHTQSCERKDN